jgi:hypothetical protein
MDEPPKKRGPGRPKTQKARAKPTADGDDDDDDSRRAGPHVDDDDDHDNGNSDDDDDDDGSHSSGDNDFSSSSGEEEEDSNEDEDDDDNDDGSDDDDGEGEDEDDGRTPSSALHQTESHLHLHKDDENPRGRSRGDAGTEHDNGEELRRQRKLLKKKLKHSAANKIQSQWKKKKAGRGEYETRDSKDEATGKKTELATGGKNDDNLAKNTKKKKRNGIVEKPRPEIVEWARNMSEKKCRKHIASGMRVKVRFAVPVKRDGKTIKKKIWYGGRVTAVSKMGSKIRIKYDDGTSEVSGFPDEDIVVDCDNNGEHSVPVDRFLPPSLRQDKDDRRDSLATVESSAGSWGAMEVDAGSPLSNDHEEEVKKREQGSLLTGSGDSPTERSTNPSRPVQDEEVEITFRVTSEPINATTPTNPKDETPSERRNIPMPFESPEEGELSPGMTFKKDEPQQELSTTAFVAMDVDTEMKEANEEKSDSLTDSKETSRPNNDEMMFAGEDREKSHLNIAVELSSACKGSVNVPSEKISGEVVFPEPSPQKEEMARKQITADVSMDTSADDNNPKRKRSSSEDGKESEEPPKQKQKIKVHVPKVAHSAIGESNVGSENASSKDKTDDIENIEFTDRKGLLLSKTNDDTGRGSSKPESFHTTPSVSNNKELKQPENENERDPTKTVEAVLTDNSVDAGIHPIKELPVVETKTTKDTSSISQLTSLAFAGSAAVLAGAQEEAKEADPVHTASQGKLPVGDTKEGVCLLESRETSMDDLTKSLKKSKSNESFNAIAARGGRKAAMEAMEKMTTKDKKEKDPTSDQTQKKKKRKPKDDADGSEDKQDWVNEMEWVQCDSCHKWRVLPSNVKVSDLPNKWYCYLNVYDPKRITCDAPEQTAKQALKELKRAKKRAKRLEILQAEKVSTQGELEKEADKSSSAETAPKLAVTPKPAAKPITKVAVKSKESIEPKAEEKKDRPSSGPEEPKVEKKKRGKKAKILQQQLQQQEDQKQEQHIQQQEQDQKQPEITEALSADSTEHVVDPPKKKRRGRPPRNTSGSSQGSSENPDNVEWVQCESCSKWRKLPADVSADELPDVWVCSMNTWNTSVASCKSPEESTDAQHQEVGTSEWQLRQTHAGKYSYRAMIFGTGAKKQNRPMSERSRAAESLFQSPDDNDDDDDRAYPVCMYSKSSMFLPRTSNFHKSQLTEEKSMSVFDVLGDSNIFNELRDMRLKPKPDAYTSLDKFGKICISDLVLDLIGDNALTGDQVVTFSKMADVGEMARYCNPDIIINTLLALVKDGVLEMSCPDPTIPIQQWIPQFRRTRTPRAQQIADSIKSSSNIKISKPWKRRDGDTQSGWVTGGGA